MKKRIWLLLLIVLASILLTGCALQTVDEMYALPKRSKEYDSLQSAIDSAMYGLSYSAPVSGENQQTVQMADLDGDGVEEYIVCAGKLCQPFAGADFPAGGGRHVPPDGGHPEQWLRL